MTPPNGEPEGALLLGSVPLPDAEAVFRTACSLLGDRLRRVPDGETGPRWNWIAWQVDILAAHHQLEQVAPPEGALVSFPVARVRTGVEPGELTFGSLGYAQAAIDSYAVYSQLKAAGVIPGHVRFQVSLPTPLAPVSCFVHPDSQASVEPAYERRLLEELEQILDAVPHGELAIQWDVAVEFGILWDIFPAPFESAVRSAEIRTRLLRLGSLVPEEVELGYHLCYGDYQRRHYTTPQDLRNPVDMANTVLGGLERLVNWIHMPVCGPKCGVDGSADAYLAPLADLELPEATDLYLGVVHEEDGVEGTRNRIQAARRRVSSFGVATECGMGRRSPDQIPNLLRLHAAVSRPVV